MQEDIGYYHGAQGIAKVKKRRLQELIHNSKSISLQKPKIRLIPKKTVITTQAGISAEKDLTTVGDTPGGILMVQLLSSTHL